MSSLLIEKGFLHPSNTVGDKSPIGFVFVENDRITIVSEGTAPENVRKQADQVIDASGQIVMPGLINAHVHLFQTLIRGLSDNRPLIPWLEEVAFPVYENMQPDEIFLAVQMGIIENIRGGSTAVTDDFTVLQPQEGFDAVFQAAKDSGIRYKMARGYSDTGYPELLMETGDLIINGTLELFERWCKDNEMLSIDFSPNVVWSTTGETLEKVVQSAHDYDLGIHIHTAEAQEENELCIKRNGMRQIPWLDSIGALGPKTQLAHGIWIDQDEVEIIADRGTAVVHNPVSNMFIGTGICPVDKYQKAGVNVALGTDGQAVSCGQEMLDVLKWTANLQKVHHNDPDIITPCDVLNMAWKGGAYAFGEPGDLGSLEEGTKADLILVDLGDSRVSQPTLSISSQIVNFSRKEDVVTTIVDGKVLMKDREILFLDEENLIKEFKQARAGLLERTGIL